MAHPINLDSLHVLATIHEKGSFAAAAEALYKVPSALTYTVNKLEQELGVKLFDRTGHRAVLTEAGKLVLHEGKELLDAAQRLNEKVKEVESGWEPRITIAVDTIMPYEPVLDAVSAFCHLNKPVNIEIIEEVLGGGWDALHTKRADIAVGVSGEASSSGFELIPLAEAEFVFVVSCDHPLANEQEPISAQLISQYPAIIVKDSSRTLPDRSSGIFAAHQRIHVTSVQQKIMAQKRGIGIGFLPRHLIHKELLNGQLVTKLTEIPRPKIPLYLAKSKHSQGKAVQWFIDYFRQINWITNELL